MRNPALALATTALLSVGFFSTSTPASAQTAPPSGAVSEFGTAIDRHVLADFSARPSAGASMPDLASLRRMFSLPAQEFLDIPASVPAMDCGMPMMKGDPNVDPKIVTPPPADHTTHFLRTIPAPWCARSPR